MNIKPDKIKKILCIKPRGIGDIVLSTIILDNLHNYFNHAVIDFLTEDFAAHAVVNNPLVNKVLTMKNKEFPLKVAWRIRKEKYDLVLDLWSNPRTAQITFLTGVKYRAGFAYRGRKYAYNILATSRRGTHHSAEHNLEILKSINVPVVSKKIEFIVDDEDYQKAKEFVKKNLPAGPSIIGIIPSGGWASKRCDASKWVDICKNISERFEAVFLIMWGPGDEQDAAYILKHIPGKAFRIPPTTLKELTGYIKNCSLVLANDSGPMHISAAMDIPTIGLFGPTNPTRHGPYSEKSGYVIKEDLFCIICNKRECPYNHECFLGLSSEKVISKINELTNKNNLKLKLHEKS